MALRSTWGDVIERVRAEARLSTNTSRGVDHIENIRAITKRVYKTLAEEYDWRHLELKRDSSVSRKVLQAGSRYYDYPAAVNPQKIERAWVKWGGVWLPLDYGITYGGERTAFDPDNDQRADPVTRWMAYGEAQFEVWPLPASNGVADGSNEVAFEGQKLVTDLTDDTSRLDLDDHLVVLMAATEILAGNSQDKAAQVKGAAAGARLERLRANTGSGLRVRMGLGAVNASNDRWPRHPRYVR